MTPTTPSPAPQRPQDALSLPAGLAMAMAGLAGWDPRAARLDPEFEIVTDPETGVVSCWIGDEMIGLGTLEELASVASPPPAG